MTGKLITLADLDDVPPREEPANANAAEDELPCESPKLGLSNDEPASPWIRADEVIELPVEWLWEPWIARGELTLIESAPKAGKSTVLRDIVAHRTSAVTIWLSTEEHAGKAIVPALRAAKADLERVILRHDLAESWAVDRMDELEALIADVGAELVVIDAIKDVLRIGGEEREMDVRAALRKLQRLAHRTGVPIVGVRHHRKSGGRAGDKGAGSVAYGAIAATVLGIFKEGDGGLVLGRVWGRFGMSPDPIAFALVDHNGRPVVKWGDKRPGLDLDDLCRDEPSREHERDGVTKLAGAVDALRTALAGGARSPKDLRAELEPEHKWVTVERAANMLGVVKDREGFGGGSRWSLPHSPHAAPPGESGGGANGQNASSQPLDNDPSFPSSAEHDANGQNASQANLAIDPPIHATASLPRANGMTGMVDEPPKHRRLMMSRRSTGYQHDDGGRAAAGFKGETGDCVVRAITIATELPYQQVYDDLTAATREYGEKHRGRVARWITEKGATVRGGVFREVYEPYLKSRGWEWVPTMKIGGGCKVHLRGDELPAGRLIVAVSKHVCAVIDGVVHDIYEDSRDGTRCVYGYYQKVQP